PFRSPLFHDDATRRQSGAFRRDGDPLGRDERVGMRVRDEVLMRQLDRDLLQLRRQRHARQDILPKLKEVAVELTHQNLVTYAHPDSLIPPERITVAAKRPGLTARG